MRNGKGDRGEEENPGRYRYSCRGIGGIIWKPSVLEILKYRKAILVISTDGGYRVSTGHF